MRSNALPRTSASRQSRDQLNARSPSAARRLKPPPQSTAIERPKGWSRQPSARGKLNEVSRAMPSSISGVSRRATLASNSNGTRFDKAIRR